MVVRDAEHAPVLTNKLKLIILKNGIKNASRRKQPKSIMQQSTNCNIEGNRCCIVLTICRLKHISHAAPVLLVRNETPFFFLLLHCKKNYFAKDQMYSREDENTCIAVTCNCGLTEKKGGEKFCPIFA